MGNLKMNWNRENGRLVCHWVDFDQKRGPLSPVNVRGSGEAPRRPSPLAKTCTRLELPSAA